MAHQYISVKVSGNQISSTGFVPLLLYNNPDIDIPDKGYVGFDSCSYFYTITTSESQNIFKLVKNNVRSSGAIRPGNLVIAFSIPKHYKLDGGYTPYDVLGKLKDEFLKKCMTLKDAIRDAYEFNPGRIDQHVLDEVASEFTISPSPTPNRIMNTTAPKGYIVRSDAEIEKLFHDINYPEFDNYSEVIVAEFASRTSYTLINNIQIPRPKSYSVFVDGRLHGSYTNLNESIIVLSSESPEFYENKKVSFTIQNLLDKDLITASGIEFDEGTEMVKVSTKGWATPKHRKIKLHIVPKDYENYILTHSNLISITWSYGEIKLDQDFSFTLIGEQIAEIKRNSIKLSLKPNDRYKLANYDIYGDKLRATVSEIRSSVVQRTGGTGQYRYQQQEKVTDLQVIKTSPVYDVSILLGGKVKFEEGDEIAVKLKAHLERSNLTLATCRTKFRAISKSNEVFEGHFYVPKDLPRPLYLCFQINDKNYITKQPLSFSNEKAVVEEKDFVISNVEPFYKKRSFIIKLLIPFMAILFGFIIGFALHDGIKNLFGETKQSSVLPNPSDDRENTPMTEDQAAAFLKDADNNLRREDLDFSEFNALYKTYYKNKNIIDDIDEKRFDNKVCDRIEDYNKVIMFITKGEIENLRTVIDNFNHNNYHIWPQHADLIKQILKDNSTIEQFRNNYNKISGFALIGDMIAIDEDASNNTVHTNTYACDKCTKTFTSQDELIKHKNKKHTTQQRFTCSVCGQDMWFNTEDELETHSKIHQERL